jgi:DNA mismatch repair protein MutL
VAVSGFVSRPSVNRVNRTGQYFFVNNRPIKSPALSFALQQGYEGLLPPKRHGLAFLFLDIVLPRVDVNVHPNKKEVRVANEREVQKLIIDVVRATLHGDQPFSPPRQSALERMHPIGFDGRDAGNRKAGAEPYRQGSSAPTAVREPTIQFVRTQSGREEGAPGVGKGLPFHDRSAASNLRVIGQFQATYILAEYEDKLIIVDQHAAHERIVYEKVLEQLRGDRTTSQRELIPTTFSLDYREQEVLEICLPELEKLGFGINSLGRNTYSIDAVPALFASEGAKELLYDIIHEMAEWQYSRSAEDKHRAVAAAIACKRKAIKAAARLSPDTMEQLVSDLFKTGQPFLCPHGRPTCINFPADDLERRFGRT